MAKDNSNSGKKKCFLCGGWQSSKYMRAMEFNGIEEELCLNCIRNIEKREDSMEQVLIEMGEYEDDENPFKETE